MEDITSYKNECKLLCWTTTKYPEDTDYSKIVAFYVKLSIKRVHFLRCNKAFIQQSHTKLNQK
jgi:hypothetical protein